MSTITIYLFLTLLFHHGFHFFLSKEIKEKREKKEKSEKSIKKKRHAIMTTLMDDVNTKHSQCVNTDCLPQKKRKTSMYIESSIYNETDIIQSYVDKFQLFKTDNFITMNTNFDTVSESIPIECKDELLVQIHAEKIRFDIESIQVSTEINNTLKSLFSELEKVRTRLDAKFGHYILDAEQCISHKMSLYKQMSQLRAEIVLYEKNKRELEIENADREKKYSFLRNEFNIEMHDLKKKKETKTKTKTVKQSTKK